MERPSKIRIIFDVLCILITFTNFFIKLIGVKKEDIGNSENLSTWNIGKDPVHAKCEKIVREN